MRLLAIALSFVVLVAGAAAGGKNRTWVEVDFHTQQGEHMKAFAAALSLRPEDEDKFFLWVLANHTKIPSALYYAMGNRLLARNPAQALRWTYSGRLQMMRDLAQCTAKGTQEGFMVMDKVGEAVLRHGADHPEMILPATRWALEWEAERPSTESPAWNCLIAVNVFKMAVGKGKKDLLTELPALVPKARRTALRDKARADFLKMQQRLSRLAGGG